MSTDGVSELLDAIALVDHHCHGVVDEDLNRADFEQLMTESDWPAPPGTTHFDSQVGFAVRGLCAPALGLAPWVAPQDYLARRTELGAPRVNELLLRAAGIGRFLVDTGFRPDDILTPRELARRAGGRADAVVRLEHVMETLAREQVAAADFVEAFEQRLTAELVGAVGVKTIAAYRINLDFDPNRPTPAQVQAAAREWLGGCAETGVVRLADPVLIRHGIWAAIDRRLPIQFHVGYGDAHVDLHRCSPVHLTDLMRQTLTSGARIMLLHCYPYHREAGYLAQVFPHVHLDVGLAINYTGARSEAVIAESLELAPFHKVLFSSDAFGLAELYYLGAELYRRGLGRVLARWRAELGYPEDELRRIAELMSSGNAMRVYGLADD